MTYRSLLVHLGADARSAVRTQTAVSLARSLQAHLVGLAPTGLLAMPSLVDPMGAVSELGVLAWAAMRAQAEDQVVAFRSACRVAGLTSFEAVTDEEDTARSLVRHAHCSDLVILSQPDPGATDAGSSARAVLEQVLLHAARPSLVLPYAGEWRSLGRRALVAWDDSREAARALADALPMLRLAESVQVIAWDEAGSPRPPVPSERLDSLQRWLMWQGVSAECRIERSTGAIAETILSRACDLGSDLLVMGAYGHSRWTERLLGGATRGLIGAMTLPVLMSR